MRNQLLINSIERIVRRTKNPNFRFDPNLTSSMLFSLIANQCVSRLRALKLIFRGRLVKGLQLGTRVELKNFSRIELGSGIKLENGVVLDGLGSGKLSLDDNCSIGAYSRLVISTSYSDLGKFIKFGKNVGLGEFSYIGGAGGVSIGSGCIIGQYLSIHPENHNFDSLDIPIRHQGVTRLGVKIEENVWIGAKVTITDGVRIGKGSIVAAGAVISKGTFPENSVIGGVPAKIIRSRKSTL